jgi:PncC family amidohydrolase
MPGLLLIRKYDHLNNLKVHYEGRLVKREAHSITANAEWTSPIARLGYVTLEAGDIFVETFYDNRWYNIFKITAPDGTVKGWYANVTRPSRILPNDIEWDDLALDVWMWPNSDTKLMDEHEFEEIKPDLSPIEQHQALAAVDDVKQELKREWRAFANDEIARALTKQQWTIGTAESCTGGLIGDELTNRAGSSDYFLGGVISYSNAIKQNALSVSADTLNSVGAVSEATAIEMARGVRNKLGVDVGISATGIAGPGGGSDEKPVGLVYIGFSSPKCELAQKFVWPHDRIGNKRATADAAMKLLMEKLSYER